MTRTEGNYKPQKDTAAMLSRAYELVQGVPYAVSARWLFYRLLQDGYYSSKSDYGSKFLKALSAARHAFYGGWRPDTLADETREAVLRGHGYHTPQAWMNKLAKDIVCNLAKWSEQEYYVELWFEARAMVEQFKHYTDYITLRPMGGQPSIAYKYDSAKFLEDAHSAYHKPIVILYFGDLDEAGETISATVRADVEKWCSVPFRFIHCGLNAEQVIRYNVPENFEHPGYQWEALDDNAAREIITEAVEPFLRHDAFSKTVEQEQRAETWLREKLATLSTEWQG